MDMKLEKVKSKYNVIDYVPEANVGLIEVVTTSSTHFKAYDLSVDIESRIFHSLMDAQKEREWMGEKGMDGMCIVDRNRTVEQLIGIIPKIG